MRAREIVRVVALAAVALAVASHSARAQGAELVFSSGSAVLCPAVDAQLLIGFWNRTSSSQVIEAAPDVGTTIEMHFPVPVLRAQFTGNTTIPLPAGGRWSVSGNILTVHLRENYTVRSKSNSFGVVTYLDLRGVPSGTPLQVAVSVDPPSAINFEGRVDTTVRGLVDARACQPPLVSEITIEDLTRFCPSADEVAAFNAALDLWFESDPTAGTLVCRASEGSADLTRLQERTYQVLRVMKSLPFDAPLPWTSKSFYDWFTGAIRGIRYRSDISGVFCCNPDGVINVRPDNLAILYSGTECCILPDSALVNLAGVFAHEARHNETGPHTCGSNDLTLTEVGAWGVQFYFSEWAAFRVGSFLTRRTPPPYSNSYSRNREDAWGLALGLLLGGDCDCGPGGTLGGGAVASPAQMDFGAQTLFAASSPRSVAITHTQGATVTITDVRLSGAQSADFSVMSPPCAGAVLPPSCAVVLRFTPSGTGVRTARLTATLSNGLQRTVELRGAGRP